MGVVVVVVAEVGVDEPEVEAGGPRGVGTVTGVDHTASDLAQAESC